MDFKKWIAEKNKVLYGILFAAVLLVISFLCFYQLDHKYVDPYDEARHGVNAYEMLRQGKLIESTYGYETDYYNLKPPLSMWCIMLSFRLLGRNVFALRAYSAVCYLLLSAGVGLFVKSHYGAVESILAMGFLAVNTAPFQAHMIRAGDADCLYVLLFTLAMLCMMEIGQRQNALYLCGFFFSLAFLAKSFHAGVIAVIGFFYLLLAGELKKQKPAAVIKFAAITAAPLLFWAFLRFFVDGTAFFRRMLYVDVLGRTNGTLDNNRQPFGWYAEYFIGTMSGRLTVYLWALVICMIGAVYYSKLFTKAHYRRILGYLLWILVPFLAFSAVTNKLIWYMYPVTVPLLMCAGIVSGRLLKEQKLSVAVKVMLLCALAVLFVTYGSREIRMIKSQGTNEFQLLIKEAAEEYGSGVEQAYVALSEGDAQDVVKTIWAQQDVLVAEMYGDWRCEDGGSEAFLRSGKGILFVSKALLTRSGQTMKDGTTGESSVQRSNLESEHYAVFIRY